ncbi:hypothetical protein KY285_005849 [Solanum tuberosum]|nr:hypothetical protein KY289_006302 [Solanum tuberosum]KAH0752701.1 hypothetical protein KY285_005849 [Solanum tuberosum]
MGVGTIGSTPSSRVSQPGGPIVYTPAMREISGNLASIETKRRNFRSEGSDLRLRQRVSRGEDEAFTGISYSKFSDLGDGHRLDSDSRLFPILRRGMGQLEMDQFGIQVGLVRATAKVTEWVSLLVLPD